MDIVHVVDVVHVGGNLVILYIVIFWRYNGGMVAQQKILTPNQMSLREAATLLCPPTEEIGAIKIDDKQEEQIKVLIRRYEATYTSAIAEGSHAAAVSALHGIRDLLKLGKDGDVTISGAKSIQIIVFNDQNANSA